MMVVVHGGRRQLVMVAVALVHGYLVLQVQMLLCLIVMLLLHAGLSLHGELVLCGTCLHRMLMWQDGWRCGPVPGLWYIAAVLLSTACGRR